MIHQFRRYTQAGVTPAEAQSQREDAAAFCLRAHRKDYKTRSADLIYSHCPYTAPGRSISHVGECVPRASSVILREIHLVDVTRAVQSESSLLSIYRIIHIIIIHSPAGNVYPRSARSITMNVELAQIIALIAYGNEYLSSLRRDSCELFPSHSTFQYVSDVSFQNGKVLDHALGKPQILAKDTHNWFSNLETDGIRYLKLDLLNLQHLPSPYATSLFAAGGAWVIQTDKGKCWQAKWSFTNQVSRQAKIWKVEYWERENLPVIKDFPDIETAYRKLENSLVEAQNFSERRKFGWEEWFEQAAELLHDPSPILPFYADLLPSAFKNIKARQLLAGALKAWVFGGLGSWNDTYIIDSSLEKEYQQISKNLYQAVMESVGAVTNSTVDYRVRELLTC